MPSVDKVGRYFPLTFATSLGEDVQPFQIVEEATSWFAAAETLALTVLNEEKIDADTIKSSLGALDNTVMQGEATSQPILQGGEWGLRLTGVTSETISSSVCNELVRFQVGPYSVWWTLGTDEFASMGLVAPDLPDPLCFSQLLAGSWGDSPPNTTQENVTSETTSTGELV